MIDIDRLGRFTCVLTAMLVLGAGAPSASAQTAAPAPAPATAPTPAAGQQADETQARAVIQRFCDTLLTAMKDADTLKFQGRYALLEPVITETFDLPTMTRLAVGAAWNSIPADKQQRLIEAFRKFTIATYASRFDGYSGERFEIDQPRPTQNGMLVPTTIVQSNGDEVSINYLLHRADNTWKVIDIYLTGTISELATRRSEFSSIIQRQGVDALISTLEERAKKLAT
jgi:phospholipid transport system substrate-binding protein